MKQLNEVLKSELITLRQSTERIKRNTTAGDNDIKEIINLLEVATEKLNTAVCYRTDREEILRETVIKTYSDHPKEIN